jgi:hypothetical protein
MAQPAAEVAMHPMGTSTTPQRSTGIRSRAFRPMSHKDAAMPGQWLVS